MNDLSPKEKDLLERVKKKPELGQLFLRKVKGLKWFDALSNEGYFDAENIPRPRPSEREGYLLIPPWGIGEYLIKTASELTGEDGSDYAPRFLEIISEATAYAKEHKFGNYRVWRQFAETVSQIPSRFVKEEFLENTVDYWLDDRFEKYIVLKQVAEKWLPKLLEEKNDRASRLALKLIDILYKVVEIAEPEPRQKKILFRCGNDEVNEITDEVAFLSGYHLGSEAVSVFRSRLEKMLEVLGNDSWSGIWQPSIDKSDGEDHVFDLGNVLVKTCRECLRGWFESCPEEAGDYVGKMTESSFQTVKRLAIYFITHQFQTCGEHAGKLVDEKFFSPDYRNEFWHFLNRCYTRFDPAWKSDILELIKKREALDTRSAMLEVSTAYEQAFWLAAVKDSDGQAESLYEKAVSVAGTEPVPATSSRAGEAGVGWITEEPAHPTDELNLLSTKELARRLRAGLNCYTLLAKFKDCGFPCQRVVTRAYSELWKEKASLPWDDIWACLLEFFYEVVNSEKFKNNASAPGRSEFVSAVAEFLESGAWSDDHAFDEKHHGKVESVIACMLENEKGVKFSEAEDKVFRAINSPRGKCIQALINLTLRSCRLSRRRGEDDRSSVWEEFRHYYDAELRKPDSDEFEFSTLITAYLSNFLYMSREWVLSNLETIFDKKNYLRWLCAMEGYYYAGISDRDIYLYLIRNGDLSEVLDDENIMHRVKSRIIENAASVYITDPETLGDDYSMINVLVNRGVPQELDILIHVVMKFKEEGYSGMQSKIYELWPLLTNAADFSKREGRMLASSLCRLSAFVDYLDDDRMKLLLKIAPHADESYTPHDLLQNLARLSEKQPFEANKILLKILERTAPTYPEEAIQQILSNLVSKGEEGKRTAEKTVDKYIKWGVEVPLKLLKGMNKS